MTDIETLWAAVCAGKIKILQRHYRKYPKATNMRYEAFGYKHSLLMGAYRTDNFEIVDYLISVGETLTKEEQEEINLLLKRAKYLEILGGIIEEE